MKKNNLIQIKGVRSLAVLLMFVTVFAAGTAFCADVYLRADTFTKTMPDATAVTMWGYVLTDSSFTPLPGETAKVPGPTITVTEGDTLNIHVRNNITGLFTEPTSVIIHGQTPSLAPGSFPTWTDGTTGARANTAQRVRSFTTETPVTGTVVYTWTNVNPGTYLYQSGTHSAVQVQMGLYGPLIVNPAAAGRAYNDPATAFDNQVVLLFSEIDPELHFSIESGRYGTPSPPPPAKPLRGQRTSTEDYNPKYFLVNGEPYSPSLSPMPAGNPNETLLIRFLNAGLLEKTPSLQNHMTIIAEDGNLHPYFKEQYSLLLPAGKTMDALFTRASAGYVPVFDRSLNLTNDAVSPGGDRLYLQVGAPQDTLIVAKDGTGKGTITAQSLPGGIACGPDCSESYISGTEIKLVGTPDPGSLLTNWTGGGCAGFGDCILTLNEDTTVTGTFTAFGATQVLTPTKGEVLPGGSQFTIWWGAPANAKTFNIRFSSNNGTTWTTIAKGVIGNSYPWSVPVLNNTRTACRVKVIGFNAKGKRIGADNSARFTISAP